MGTANSEEFYLFIFISVDNNRVVLRSSKDYRPTGGSYINASLISVEFTFFLLMLVCCCRSKAIMKDRFDYILSLTFLSASCLQTSSPGSVSQFIATQGPLHHTYEDFWEMVMQYNCPAIVMLTRLVDHYKVLVGQLPVNLFLSLVSDVVITWLHKAEQCTRELVNVSQFGIFCLTILLYLTFQTVSCLSIFFIFYMEGVDFQGGLQTCRSCKASMLSWGFSLETFSFIELGVM